jgi:sugar lactone lactonase YvrE
MAQPLTTLVSSGVNRPAGVAVDGTGNVYIADTGNAAIKEWAAANNSVTTLVCSGLANPTGVAVDGAGNVYIADNGTAAIYKWTVANSNVTSLVSSGLSEPHGVAVDGTGNVYFTDTGNDAIKEWTEANSNVITLVSANLYPPYGVALDVAGNVYVSDFGNFTISEWTATNNTFNTYFLSSGNGLNQPEGLAVDGSGNVYVAGYYDFAPIQKWMATESLYNPITTLVGSGLNQPGGVAVDGAGNVYIADTGDNEIKELPYAFVDPTPKSEPPAAGSDALPIVLPATENLLPPFAPTSDQTWLAISGITNGVVNFSFTANISSSNRIANITLLGQTIPVTQAAPIIGVPPTLTSAAMLGNGVLQFNFTNMPGALFTVLSTTNLSLPLSNWTEVGTASNVSSDLFQFTSQPATNGQQRFFIVRSP